MTLEQRVESIERSMRLWLSLCLLFFGAAIVLLGVGAVDPAPKDLDVDQLKAKRLILVDDNGAEYLTLQRANQATQLWIGEPRSKRGTIRAVVSSGGAKLTLMGTDGEKPKSHYGRLTLDASPGSATMEIDDETQTLFLAPPKRR